MMCNCNWRFNCTLTAIVTAVIAGVVAAFLQILGIVTVTTGFVVGALITGAVYLAVGVLASANLRRSDTRACCVCRTLNTILVGVLGTILSSLVLLAVGITATSVVSAILIGLLLFFLWLTVAASACFIRCAADCD